MKEYAAFLEAAVVFLMLIVAVQALAVYTLVRLRRGAVDSGYPLWFKRSPYDDSTKDPPR